MTKVQNVLTGTISKELADKINIDVGSQVTLKYTGKGLLIQKVEVVESK